MPNEHVLTVSVKFDGQEKLGENNLKFGKYIGRVVVEQRLDSPDYFSVDLQIMETGKQQAKDFMIIDKVKLGMEVEIAMGFEQVETVFKGEVSYIEPSFQGGDLRVTVSGYDFMHRLTRGTTSKTFGDGHKQEVVPKTVASSVVGDSKARRGEVAHALSASADGGEAKVEYLSQVEVSDYHFLESLGYGGQVRDSRNQKDAKAVSFKPVDTSGEAKLVICRDKLEPATAQRPVSAEFSLSSVRQVGRVEVRGWNPKEKKAFVGKCEAVETKLPSDGTSGPEASGKAHFGGASSGPVLTIIDHPVFDQKEAEELAKAIFNGLAMQYVRGEVVTEGFPKICAGDVVELKQFSTRFDGKYLVEALTHEATGAGDHPFTTRLQVMRNAAKDP